MPRVLAKCFRPRYIRSVCARLQVARRESLCKPSAVTYIEGRYAVHDCTEIYDLYYLGSTVLHTVAESVITRPWRRVDVEAL